jgi:hypothetical protein
MFAAFTVALVAVGARLPSSAVERGPAWSAVAGVALIAFGWIYPHFLETDSIVGYLFSAPTGLLPCPSLSVVIGFTLLAGGFQDRPWSYVLAGEGLFYGIFGVAALRVPIDLALIAGSAALLVLALRSRPRQRPEVQRPNGWSISARGARSARTET